MSGKRLYGCSAEEFSFRTRNQYVRRYSKPPAIKISKACNILQRLPGSKTLQGRLYDPHRCRWHIKRRLDDMRISLCTKQMLK
jgi:hypothetical protein